MLFQFGDNLTALYGKYEVPESHEEFEEVANEYLRNVGGTHHLDVLLVLDQTDKH